MIESVGEGAEEYYLGSGEARGEWLGDGARELGLAGPVEGEELRRLFAGLDPRDGATLRSSRAKVAGFDLTFSAPKSVSVVFGIADPEVRRAVRAAHDRAVAEAVWYLERSAAAVRRGHGGAVVEQASGLVAAAFRHRMSRAGDPQLHTHVLVANLARGVEWPVDGAGCPAAVCRGADRELRLSGGATGRADAVARGRVDAGAEGDRRDRRCATRGAEGVQPAAG